MTLACLLPFLGKAFHIDDPLFIWAARHIHSHPADFYGFNVDWSFGPRPMSVEMLNPPLACYYLAAVGTVLGWSEQALHFGFLFPALAFVLGTYFLARRFCNHPLAAALAMVATPVFLISSTSLMCDTMMAALWVWAVFFWMEGIDAEKPGWLLLAALLVAACSLTKYYGLSLIPLLAVYSALQRRRLGSWLLYLACPVLILAAYQWLTVRLYGRGLLWNATGYVAAQRVTAGWISRMIETLSFSGGCLFIVLPALPLLWGRRGMIMSGTGVLAAGGLMAAMKEVGGFPVVEGGHVKWFFLLQLALFVVGGAILVALAVHDALRQHTPASSLLLLWVAGVLFFVCAVNWTVSGRNILPLAPAAALLIIRRLEFRQADSLRFWWWPLGVSLAVALMVAWGDWRLANSAREIPAALKGRLAPSFDHIAFEGHWGFQYYMEQMGAKPLAREPLVLAPYQAVVIPMNNACIFDLPANLVEAVAAFEITPAEWISVQNFRAGAGYYSADWGPAPFLFGPAPPETYRILRVRQRENE
jgi:hypothetical protein